MFLVYVNPSYVSFFSCNIQYIFLHGIIIHPSTIAFRLPSHCSCLPIFVFVVLFLIVCKSIDRLLPLLQIPCSS
ncbi:hypothetical protein F5H01DRAFT_54309 [Linnemannia elongata]|nr:hypothetical protein F5H01DRAFT_54309 [Linnemannia elongata]